MHEMFEDEKERFKDNDFMAPVLTLPGQSLIRIIQRHQSHQRIYQLWYYSPHLSGSILRQRGILSGFQTQESKLKSFRGGTKRSMFLRLLLLALGLLLCIRAINSVIGSSKNKEQSKERYIVSNLDIKLIGVTLSRPPTPQDDEYLRYIRMSPHNDFKDVHKWWWLEPHSKEISHISPKGP
jgi:hypothetical protein